MLDALVCFAATALGSLSPQALNLLDPPASRAAAVRVDADSGKFTDRVLIGGLQPLSWEPEPDPAPAFARLPMPESGQAEAPPASAPRSAPAAASRPPRELAAKKPEKAVETKTAEAVPAAAPAPEPPPPAAEAKAEAPEQGILATLSPARLTSRIAPVGQKIWSGARALGGAVVGWVGD